MSMMIADANELGVLRTPLTSEQIRQQMLEMGQVRGVIAITARELWGLQFDFACWDKLVGTSYTVKDWQWKVVGCDPDKDEIYLRIVGYACHNTK